MKNDTRSLGVAIVKAIAIGVILFALGCLVLIFAVNMGVFLIRALVALSVVFLDLCKIVFVVILIMYGVYRVFFKER